MPLSYVQILPPGVLDETQALSTARVPGPLFLLTAFQQQSLVFDLALND